MRSWFSQTVVSRVRFNNHKQSVINSPTQLNHICSKRHLNDDARRHASSGQSRRVRPEIVLGRHVREALLNNSPIVALESTVITHGLPEPSNLELALRLEAEIARGYWWRDTADEGEEEQPRSANIGVDSGGETGSRTSLRSSAGGSAEQQRTTQKYSGVVTPATIGIVKGQIVVGLSRDEIEYLACRERSHPIKASRRDIPIALAMGLSAGTTVSATMAIASSSQLMALAWNPESSGHSSATVASSISNQRSVSYGNNLIGRGGSAIKVFATGGMGGVHLGGEQSMDISADLYEFARSPIGLVSSGFKSFLDTRRSLEFLETLGCTVTSLVGSDSIYQAEHCFAADSNNGDRRNLPNRIELSRGSDNSDELGRRRRRANVDDDNDGLQSDTFLDSHRTQQQQHRGHLFPGFFSTVNKERVQSPWQCANVKEAAEILFACLEASLWQQQHQPQHHGLDSRARAMLLACPIPGKFSLNLDEDQEYKRAMEVVSSIDRRQDLAGNEKTPLILEQLNQSTGGKTLRANMELLKNNARVGAHLAYEYALLSGPATRTGAILPTSREPQASSPPRLVDVDNIKTTEHGAAHTSRNNNNPPVVIGCTMIDMHVSTKIDHHFKTNPANSGITFEGKPHLTLGGVGRNLACAIELLGHRPTFVTSLAHEDNLSEFALNELNKFGLTVNSTRLKVNWANQQRDQARLEPASACFALVLMDSISGQCEYVIADLKLNEFLNQKALERLDVLDKIREAPLLVLDANLSDRMIDYLIEFCNEHKVPIFLEPTDVVCLKRLADCLARRNRRAGASNKPLAFLSPNVIELAELLANFGDSNDQHGQAQPPPSVESIEEMGRKLMTDHLPDLKCLLVTMDRRGVYVLVSQPGTTSVEGDIDQVRPLREFNADGATLDGTATILGKYYQTPRLVENPVSVSGAGDSFASGFISGLLNDLNLVECVRKGFRASYLSLLDKDTIPKSLKELRSGPTK